MEQELSYKDLNFDGKSWDEESLRIIEDMLEVWDSGHRIIICHPNKVFLHKPISAEKRDITNLDWLELADKFTFNDDSFMNIYPDSQETFRYIHRRFRHELFNGKKVQQPRHLVVLEQDRMGGALVRGIFRADEQSLKVAESPYYAECKPKSIWEKQLRWTADDERFFKANVEGKSSSGTAPSGLE